AQPWGSPATLALGDTQRIVLEASDGIASDSFELHGQVPANQQAAAVGNYRSDFIADAVFNYAEGTHDCSTLPPESTTTAPFAVTASVAANCLIETSDLDFGSTGQIGSNIDAETDFDLTCTSGTGYSIAISGGGSGDPANRL